MRWTSPILWVNFGPGGRVIEGPTRGSRVSPPAEAAELSVGADMMDFDPEVAVRLVWRGVPVINLPTKVRYVSRDEGGVSHFRLIKDNFLISWMHTRLCLEKVFGTLIGRRYRGTVRQLPAES